MFATPGALDLFSNLPSPKHLFSHPTTTLQSERVFGSLIHPRVFSINHVPAGADVTGLRAAF